MQLGEAVAVGVIAEAPIECPLEHDKLEPIKSENDFVGDGATLGRNMERAKSSITFAPNKQTMPVARPYPSTEADTEWPVEVDGVKYPVTCAAHHLIPAQAALKKVTTLHEWMVYSKKPEAVGGAGATPVKGKVWADVGYDINGVENGIWLPGNYAVGNSGTGDWTSAPSMLDNEAASAKPAPPAPPGCTKLTGPRHTFSDANKKARYVLDATSVFNAQFHDSHNEYSLLVTGILEKIAELYNAGGNNDTSPCPKCAERMKQISSEGKPTRFQLAHRLNAVSERLSRYLIGKRGHEKVYTSAWGKGAYLEGMHMVSSNSPLPQE